jgi:N-acetylmuramoyl-L-alanine amidase
MPDYPAAHWVSASLSNYTVADRPDDYPVDMVVIHDIEGGVASAIKTFQDPTRAGSAHYLVDYNGAVTQMVQEKDIAWHAGNWDYNTRAIGIEHAGFACCHYYTTAEYNGSAKLLASICSRWGVTIDRNHVIGHSQVPDPYHPGLYGGDSHHWDPGPNWNWTYYMNQARAYAANLPSPPRLGPDPSAYGGDTTATVTWKAAHTCHLPVDGYTITAQPGNLVKTVDASTTSVQFTGLTNGTSYTFTVATENADGTATLTSNPVVPNPGCTDAALTASMATPQQRGVQITFTASSSTCPHPRYQFYLQSPSGSWTQGRDVSTRTTWTWDTEFSTPGVWQVRAWANEATSNYSQPQSFAETSFTINQSPKCATATITPTSSLQPAGASIPFTATSTGCPYPRYQYWIRLLDGKWYVKQSFSTNAAWTWNTSGLRPGNYLVHVWATQAGDSSNVIEGMGESKVTLTGCTTLSVHPTGGSSKVGTPVTFTGSAGGGCASPVYKYWLKDTRGVWHLMRDWGGASWTWSNAGWGKGTYTISVWANQSGSYTGKQQVYKTITYTLT